MVNTNQLNKRVTKKEKKPQDNNEQKSEVGLKHQADEWIQKFGNKHIHSGYRINHRSFSKATFSLFSKHNEVMNVWTHLVGCVVVILIGFYVFNHINTGESFSKIVQNDMNRLYTYGVNQIEDIENKLINTHFDQDSLKNYTLNKFNQLKEDYHDYKEQFNYLTHEFQMQLQSYTQDKIKDIYEDFQQISQQALEKLLITHNTLITYLNHNQFTKEIKMQVQILIDEFHQELQLIHNKFFKQVDSSDYDWIDVYNFVKQRDEYKQFQVSRFPVFVFLSTAFLCLLFSTCFHLYETVGPYTHKILQKLDYAGINLLIFGSCVPIYVYGFYCQPIQYTTYILICGSCALIVFFISLTDWIHQEKQSTLKAFMYGGFGVFSALPVIQLVYYSNQHLHNSGYIDFSNIGSYYYAMGFFYLFGLYIYTVKVPESIWPGRFDIWFNSHQIWHCFVLAGIFSTYFGSLDIYYARKITQCV